MSKVYVDVTIRFDSFGKMTPMSIIWRDGREYKIDRVLEVRRTSLGSGEIDLRYTVSIRKQTRNLFFEQSGTLRRWFVIGRQAKHCCANM